MTSNDGFWHNEDDEDVLAQYLAEHAYSSTFDGDDTFVVDFGIETQLPILCAVCNTAIKNIEDAGWRHLEGFHVRKGCTTPWPGDR